ncbi:MAG: MoaD/ThiS family protein [Desulfurococcaceae archaeon]
MIKVVVNFISIYAEKLGKQRIYELPELTTVEKLIEILSSELHDIKIKPIILVNYRFPKEGQVLNNGDVVLVMPPFAGGK